MKMPLLKIFRASNPIVGILCGAMVMLALFLSGCSGDLEELSIADGVAKTTVSVDNGDISEAEAILIANKVLKKSKTRGGFFSLPSFEYVIEEGNTRAGSGIDTLAYVLNYPNNEGFVIVSSSRRVYPVLGFADEGNFSFDNEIAKANFIDRLGLYMDENSSDVLYDVKDNDFDGCVGIDPMVQISLSQNYPWNKYITQENPDCPAGCVAVATALVMSHSKYIISYHNNIYHLRSIVRAINKGPGTSNKNIPVKRIAGGSLEAPYSYEQAVDSMARIMYWIGKDLNMEYEPDGSTAKSTDAFNLIKSLGFSITTGYEKFNIVDVANYITDNHIVYLRGREINGHGGHAWVSDATYFCIHDNDISQKYNIYIHCDWGWGGNCNGYYTGAVFEASNYELRPENYFAIKREWK